MSAPAADQAGKQDAGKPRFSLFPLDALHEVLKVLEYGAKKYTADGWRETVGAEHGQRRYLDAAYRHAFMEWWTNGERVDKESGAHHLAHAICCLLFNLQLDLERPDTDSDDKFVLPEVEEAIRCRATHGEFGRCGYPAGHLHWHAAPDGTWAP